MNIYQFLLFLLKYYCVASSSPPLSPEGPYSLVSTIYFIRLHARSYVTPLILRATKPGADDLENPWQRVFFCLFLFLSILGLLLDLFFLCVGFFFSATISIGSHRHSPRTDVTKCYWVLSSGLWWRFICSSHLHR